MAKLGLEESSEVDGFRRPKYTQMEAEHLICDLSILNLWISDGAGLLALY